MSGEKNNEHWLVSLACGLLILALFVAGVSMWTSALVVVSQERAAVVQQSIGGVENENK